MKTEMNTVKVRKTEELEAEQLGAHIGEIVRLHGSIYKIRKMSSFAFVLLRTKRQMVQCVYEPAYARFALEELKEEACVRFTAEVIREERSRSGYDLHLLEVEILGRSTAGCHQPEAGQHFHREPAGLPAHHAAK